MEIQSLKGESEVGFRPAQDLSCKWHGFAYTSFPFHFPPSIPRLLLSFGRAFKQQEKATLSAPGEPVRLTIHKVLQSAQSKPTERTEPLHRSVLLSNLWGYK